MAVAALEPWPRSICDAGFQAARDAEGKALSQEAVITKGHVDQSTRDRQQSFNDAITILRERISTWVVVDILELL